MKILVAWLCGHTCSPKASTAVQLWKRNVVIRDDSGSSVEITFWGGYAQDPGDMLQEVCRHLSHLAVLLLSPCIHSSGHWLKYNQEYVMHCGNAAICTMMAINADTSTCLMVGMRVFILPSAQVSYRRSMLASTLSWP